MISANHAKYDSVVKENILFSNNTIFKNFTAEQKTLLLENMRCRTFSRGEVIFYEGQPSYLIYFVYSGVVQLWKEGIHNLEQIIRFAHDGDIIGFWSSYGNTDYSLSATATTESVLCSFRKDVFLPLLHTNLVLP